MQRSIHISEASQQEKLSLTMGSGWVLLHVKLSLMSPNTAVSGLLWLCCKVDGSLQVLGGERILNEDHLQRSTSGTVGLRKVSADYLTSRLV